MRYRQLSLVLAAVSVAVAASAATASATATTITVTPTNARSYGWTAHNEGAGAETFTGAFGAPGSAYGTGALELTTTASDADQAYFGTSIVKDTPLSAITTLSYWNYTNSGPSYAGASLDLEIDTHARCGRHDPGSRSTTLVYEPYWNTAGSPGQVGTVAQRVWTQWSIASGSGLFWSQKSTCDAGGGGLAAQPGGPPTYTLEDVLTAYPDATLEKLAVDVGSYNPGYDVAVDGVTINDTTYDFAPGS